MLTFVLCTFKHQFTEYFPQTLGRMRKKSVNSYFFACIYVRIILKCAHEHDIYRISEVHDMQEG